MKFAMILSIMLLSVGCATGKKKDNLASANAGMSKPAAEAKTENGDTPKPTKSGECKKEKDDRTLSVMPDGVGCKLVYMKFGKSTVAAHAKTGSQHCEEAFDKIESKLKSSGFTCN